jgi:hypothetical protein
MLCWSASSSGMRLVPMTNSQKSPGSRLHYKTFVEARTARSTVCPTVCAPLNRRRRRYFGVERNEGCKAPRSNTTATSSKDSRDHKPFRGNTYAASAAVNYTQPAASYCSPEAEVKSNLMPPQAAGRQRAGTIATNISFISFPQTDPLPSSGSSIR